MSRAKNGAGAETWPTRTEVDVEMCSLCVHEHDRVVITSPTGVEAIVDCSDPRHLKCDGLEPRHETTHRT